MNTLPASHATPPPGTGLFDEMRAEMRERVDALDEKVHEALPTPEGETTRLLQQLDTLSHSLETSNSTSVKKQMREALWTLRQGLENGPTAGSGPEIRKALEKVRGVCFDCISDQLSSWPSSHTVVRPLLSDVPNYEEISPRLWRGGQPDSDGADWLVARGVGTEIDLRGSDQDNQWMPPQWGPVRHFMIPVEDNQSPTFSQVEDFVRTVESAEQPVFVHCKAGIGRTGTMIACFRITRGWTADEALEAERTFSGRTLHQADFIRQFEGWWKEHHATAPQA